MGFFKGLSDWLFMRQAHEAKIAKRAVHSAASKSKGRFKWRWDSHVVTANTKSEARARLKGKLSMKRLPVGANVQRVTK